jgi:hypothetical protein
MLQASSWNVAGYSSCLYQFADFTNILVDPEDNTDFIVWENRNGDYYLDTNSSPDAAHPWECYGFPDTTPGVAIGQMGASIGEVTLDKYNWVFVSIVESSLKEAAVFTPDGTGVGEILKFADTVCDVFDNKSAKYIQNGGKYDGLYTSGSSFEPKSYGKITVTGYHPDDTWYAAADTYRGVIGTGQVAVEEDAVNAFSVAQNAPNPFNPTTTINFTIPKAGNVTMDVYNVAGQKVATLANGYMNAGTHSVVWNAAGFSAGVYFYTVKTGEFSKTMKMTLLK